MGLRASFSMWCWKYRTKLVTSCPFALEMCLNINKKEESDSQKESQRVIKKTARTRFFSTHILPPSLYIPSAHVLPPHSIWSGDTSHTLHLKKLRFTDLKEYKILWLLQFICLVLLFMFGMFKCCNKVLSRISYPMLMSYCVDMDTFQRNIEPEQQMVDAMNIYIFIDAIISKYVFFFLSIRQSGGLRPLGYMMEGSPAVP